MDETCINCEEPAHDLHHVVPKCFGGRGGRNLVPLCRVCHGLVHGIDRVKHKSLQKAGIDSAKKLGKYKGRKPSYNQEQLNQVLDMAAQGSRTTDVAIATGLSRQAVLRIKADPVAAECSLKDWGMWDGQT